VVSFGVIDRPNDTDPGQRLLELAALTAYADARQALHEAIDAAKRASFEVTLARLEQARTILEPEGT